MKDLKSKLEIVLDKHDAVNVDHLTDQERHGLERGKAWVTFIDEDWENVWHPIMIGPVHVDLKNHDTALAMAICRGAWGGKTNFGISCTSQMLIKNSTRDNF